MEHTCFCMASINEGYNEVTIIIMGVVCHEDFGPRSKFRR